MAHALRLGIFLAGLALAAFVYYKLSSIWAVSLPVCIAIAGSLISESVFNRLATPEQKRRDLEDRTRNPPS